MKIFHLHIKGMLTPDQAREHLRRHTRASPSVREWCRAHDVSETMVSEMLSGKRPIGGKIAETIRLRPTTVYEERA